MVKLAVVILAILFGVVASMMQPTLENMVPNVSVDYDSFSFTDSKKSHLRHYSIAGVYKSTGRNYSAFVAEFHPSSFSFFPPTADGCTKLVKPSESSYGTFKCDYATNGGFFTWDTTKPSLCIGNLVSEGRVWQLPTDGSGSNRANFGITFDNKLVTGFVGLDSAVLSQFKSLITGWGWLVRNGKGNVETSADLSVTSSFTTIKAPRTAVGHYKNGTMILLEVDGEEDIDYGPDLFEMSELLVSLGVESAVNLDGGGSSVSVSKGKVISLPTCNDTPEICERADASFACVRANLE